jgi:hypothetical protein
MTMNEKVLLNIFTGGILEGLLFVGFLLFIIINVFRCGITYALIVSLILFGVGFLGRVKIFV